MAEDSAVLAELKSHGSVLAQMARSLEQHGEILTQVATSLSIVMERQKTGVNIAGFNSPDGGSIYKAFALMAAMVAAMLLAVVSPAYIAASNNSDAIIRLSQAMMSDDNRERTDAAQIAIVDPLNKQVDIIDAWRFFHEAEVSRFNAEQFERLKALERHAFGGPVKRNEP